MPKRHSKMQEARKVTKQPSGGNAPFKAHGHLSRIPDREAMKRAIMVLGEVRVAYCALPDSQLLVANEHIAALQSEAIPFETVD